MHRFFPPLAALALTGGGTAAAVPPLPAPETVLAERALRSLPALVGRWSGQRLNFTREGRAWGSQPLERGVQLFGGSTALALEDGIIAVQGLAAETLREKGIANRARHLAMLAVDEQGGLVLATAGSPSLTASTRTGVTRVPVTVEGGVLRWETERLGTRSKVAG